MKSNCIGVGDSFVNLFRNGCAHAHSHAYCFWKRQSERMLKDDSIGVCKTFEITLDRNIQVNDELTVIHIAKNIEECSIRLDVPARAKIYV